MQTDKLRQELERRIARRIILDAIAAGYTISVDDGEEITVRDSISAKAILAAMFTVDDERLRLKRGKERGWVYFVYGNDGWDVVNDYTTNLEPVMAGANKIAEKYS